jgi:hypothetical protein
MAEAQNIHFATDSLDLQLFEHLLVKSQTWGEMRLAKTPETVTAMKKSVRCVSNGMDAQIIL